MHLAAPELPPLIDEHHALLRHYGQTQARCDALVRAQAAEIARLQRQAMRLRAAVIVRDTALAWERSQRMDAVLACMQNLARQRLQVQRYAGGGAVQAQHGTAPGGLADHTPDDALTASDASLAAADLVICQTGCLSHSAYWRVHDHCRRTGKTCVLVEQPGSGGIDGLPSPAPAASLAERTAAAETGAA